MADMERQLQAPARMLDTGMLIAAERGALGKLLGACTEAAHMTQFHSKYMPNQYGGSGKTYKNVHSTTIYCNPKLETIHMENR